MRDHRGHRTIDDEREWLERGVEAYLDASYRAGSRATTSEFAAQFRMDPTTLSRRFRCLFGKTPLEYFRSEQLNYAATLLRRSPLTTEQITVTAALGTRSTFFRLFFEQFGMTPDEYRRSS
jgi:AraC-like DNA-binding protein